MDALRPWLDEVSGVLSREIALTGWNLAIACAVVILLVLSFWISEMRRRGEITRRLNLLEGELEALRLEREQDLLRRLRGPPAVSARTNAAEGISALPPLDGG